MKRILLRGDVLYPEGWSEGSILLQDGKIIDVSDSTGPDLTGDLMITGLILPGLMDMHTHLGDHGARGSLPSTLEETVMPGGLKHRYLSSASREEKIASISASLKEIHPGVTFVLDYREGGLEGLELLSESLSKDGPMVCPLGRVGSGDDPEMIIDRSCGIGQPSLSKDLSDLRNLVRKKDKIFSIHASELFRENIGDILELDPDQLVHMISGTEDDWTAITNEEIPVTICPRSNLAYNMDPPLGPMMRAGMMLSLGTDNALSSKQDMFREMEASWLLLRRNGIEGSEASKKVFEIATGMSMSGSSIWRRLPRWTKWWETGWPKYGDPGHLFLLRKPAGPLWKKDPFSQLVRFSDRSMVIYTPDLSL